MLTKSGTAVRRGAPFANSSINPPSENHKAFDPTKLPTNLLDQLHELAQRQGKKGLAKTIEAEVFEREELKVKSRDLVNLN